MASAADRKKRGMRRSTARSVGRAASKGTSSAASRAASRKSADARSGRSTTSPRAASAQARVTRFLTNLPGQDRQSDANRNARGAATRVLQSSRARVAGEKGGTQRSRSASARAMNRNRRGASRANTPRTTSTWKGGKLVSKTTTYPPTYRGKRK